MRSGNRIAIVGAGIAGLVCAKVLIEDGFTVEIFDRSPDIGGVWSETRRYPGLRAQSTKDTYHFSDHPMPADYPRVLDGARMQEYLASYVRAFGLTDRLRLRTEVVAADPVDGGWLLEIRDPDGVHRTSCEHLVIANGVFSEPEIPDFTGAADFARAGGQLGHSTQFLDVEAVRDRSVVVVGYGAAAGDLATEISRVAADTTVVARRLLWKMPRRLAAGLDAERVLLTRTGAAHFRHPEPGRFARLLHGPLRSFRESNLDLIEALVAERSRAAEFGLLPDQRFEQAHEAAFGLVAEGFAGQVADGRLTVRGQTGVARLGGGPAGPYAELSDGQRIRADIVVCATGFQQRVPFLTPYVQRQLTDDHGNFRLYRQILPLDVPHLSFAGYNTSLLSAVGAEVGAHWTAALLSGHLLLPSAEVMNERVEARLRWMDETTGGRHAHGASVTPHALRDVDELLADLGVRLPRTVRAAQWLRPARPGDYRAVSRRRRNSGHTVTAPSTPVQSLPRQSVSRDSGPVSAASSPAAVGATDSESSRAQPPSIPGSESSPLVPGAESPTVPGAEPPTVRIPESAVRGNASARTALLPVTDPTTRTGPVRESRPADPPTIAHSAVRPAPVAPPAGPQDPVAGTAGPSAASATPPEHSPAAASTDADSARRAAAETRAAGIAARSNSPTVQIDMRTAQAAAAAEHTQHSEPAGAAPLADESADPAEQTLGTAEYGRGATQSTPVPEGGPAPADLADPNGDPAEPGPAVMDPTGAQASTVAYPAVSAEPDADGVVASGADGVVESDPAGSAQAEKPPEPEGPVEPGAVRAGVSSDPEALAAEAAAARADAPVAEHEGTVAGQVDPAGQTAVTDEAPGRPGTREAGTMLPTPADPVDTSSGGPADTAQRSASAAGPDTPPNASASGPAGGDEEPVDRLATPDDAAGDRPEASARVGAAGGEAAADAGSAENGPATEAAPPGPPRS